MKIALIRQRYTPFGGAERFVERALSALVAQGSEISLITRSWEGAARDGFREIICDPPYRRWLEGRSGRDRSFSNAVQRHLAQNCYDIIQSHERIPGCMIFRAGDGVHAAWLEHRGRVLSSFQRLGQHYSPYHRYVLGVEREMFEHQNLRGVICNSPMVADEINHYYNVDRSKLHVIYNGVDTQLYHPSLSAEFRSRVRTEYLIPETSPVVLFVGNGFERKGVPQLLRAFSAMENRAARLVIVGADRKLPLMRKLAGKLGIANRVLFTGPQKDVRPWYGAADAFALPTLYDPCPNAALEALSSGLPVLTSTTCGAQAWITEERNGFTVDALDLTKMSQKLDALASIANKPEIREAARQSAESYTLSAMAEKLLRLYQNVSMSRLTLPRNQQKAGRYNPPFFSSTSS